MVFGSDPVTVLGALVSLGSLFGALLTQYIGHPSDKYEEKVKKLQQDRWSEVSTELGELFVEVEESVDDIDTPDHYEDLPQAAKYSYIIQQEYNTDQLGALREKIDEVDVPLSHYKTCREARDVTVKQFVGALGAGVLGLIIYGWMPEAVQFSAVFVGGGGVLGIFAFLNARKWQESRECLDEMWEDYEFL